MNSPVVLLEKEVTVASKHRTNRTNKKEKTAEYLISLILLNRVKKTECNQNAFQVLLKQIVSTLHKHSEEIAYLSTECSKNASKVSAFEGIQVKMQSKIDSLLQKVQKLETEYSFELFKNKQILNKHELLLQSIKNSKAKYLYIVDLLLLILAYRLISTWRQKIGTSPLKTQIFSNRNTIGKATEVMAMFFLFKAIKNSFSIGSIYSK